MLMCAFLQAQCTLAHADGSSGEAAITDRIRHEGFSGQRNAQPEADPQQQTNHPKLQTLPSCGKIINCPDHFAKLESHSCGQSCKVALRIEKEHKNTHHLANLGGSVNSCTGLMYAWW